MTHKNKRIAALSALFLLVALGVIAYASYSRDRLDESHKTTARPFTAKGRNLPPPPPLSAVPRD